MANATNFNLSDISDAFKQKFEGKMLDQYNNNTVLWAKIKKSFNFQGSQINRSVGLSSGAGFGTGSLPQASHDSASYEQANITAKKVYSVVEIDRESMKAGKSSEGVFDVSALEHIAKRAVNAMNRNMERILFGNADGLLYTGNASNSNVSVSGSDYTIPLNGALADLIFANFEEGDLVSINTETTLLSIKSVSTVSGSENIVLTGTSARLATLAGANPFTTTDKIYAQGSKDNDPQGLALLSLTTGSTYGISHTSRRWQGLVIAANSAAVSEDILNQLILGIEEKTGVTPDMLVASYFQYRKIKDFMADQKRVEIQPRDERLVGKVSFSALEFLSASGSIPIVASRFIAKDRVYAINTDKIEAIHRPDWGWFDEDGTVFLRRDTSDRYQARYGGYMQLFIEPGFHGYLDGLAIA